MHWRNGDIDSGNCDRLTAIQINVTVIRKSGGFRNVNLLICLCWVKKSELEISDKGGKRKVRRDGVDFGNGDGDAARDRVDGRLEVHDELSEQKACC